MARKIWEGRDAWRNHFTVNASDLLQIQRTFAGEEVFKDALMRCLKTRSGSVLINSRTVERVLGQMVREAVTL